MVNGKGGTANTPQLVIQNALAIPYLFANSMIDSHKMLATPLLQ